MASSTHTTKPVERYTSANPEPWTKVGIHLPEVDSTNAYVQRHLQACAKTGEAAPPGYNVRADFQTHGRGRHDRVWEASDGLNLAVSYLLPSAGVRPTQLFTFSQMVALAVRDAIEKFLPRDQCCVKWPNDVYVGQRKIAGILLESSLRGQSVSHLVAGIGINVNQAAFGDAIQATSLALETGEVFNIASVWRELTMSLQQHHQQLVDCLAQADLYPLQQRYHAHLLGLGAVAVYQRKAREHEVGDRFAARLLGVTADGKLRLAVEGDEQQYDLDAVRLVRDANR